MSTYPMGRTGSLGFQMKKYSIVRMGNEFVVQAGEKSILKIASRRRAVKLITDAAELLDQQPMPMVDDNPSIARDLRIISGSTEVP